MGSNPFIGQIKCFSFNFAPRGWALCNGQLLAINQNQALFSLLGTTYGGNGTTNFALPDLRGRLPIGFGQGPFLTPRSLGEQVGAATHTLLSSELPAHTHTVAIGTLEGNASSPLNAQIAKAGQGDARFGAFGQPGQGTMAADALAPVGGSQPHSNLMPELCMNYCIALTGIFPSRN